MTLAIRSRFLFSLSNGQFRSLGIWPSSPFQIVRVQGSSRLVCFTFSSGWVVSHIIGMFNSSATHCAIESGHSLFQWSLVFFFLFAFPRSALLIQVFGGQYFVRFYSRFQFIGGLHALFVMLILRPNPYEGSQVWLSGLTRKCIESVCHTALPWPTTVALQK